MDKKFILELQTELVEAGYDDVEILYTRDSNLTLRITYKTVVRTIGLVIELDKLKAIVDGRPISFTTANDLARLIFDLDPATSDIPDFRSFTGLKSEE